MARRKRRQRTEPAAAAPIGTHEASILFAKLMELGHISAGHLRDARSAVVREVKEISERLALLRGSTHSPFSGRKAPKSVPAAEAQPASSAAKRPRKRARGAISAERRETQRLQGKYLGLMRKVEAKDLAKFKADIPKVGKAEVVRRMEAYVHAHESKGAAKTPKTARKRVERKK
jgi:hypothetical protein